MNKKAQASMEYLILVGFVTGAVLILLLLFSSFSQETQDQIRMTQAQQVSHKIVEVAERVYYLGEPSKMTVRLSIPDNVKSVDIGNNEIFFVMSTSQGDNEIGAVSKVNITGSLPTGAGIYEVSVQSKGSYVEISAS